MVTILEKEGLDRTKAIQKIIEDHKDLKGFSRATIYRELPKEVKKDYTPSSKKLSNTKNVSNETYENINITSSKKPIGKSSVFINYAV